MLEKLILSHLKYLNAVESGETNLKGPTECELGQWLLGDGQKYAETEKYQNLQALHQQFHQLVKDVVTCANNSDSQGREQALGEAYRLFGQIEHLLLNWDRKE